MASDPTRSHRRLPAHALEDPPHHPTDNPDTHTSAPARPSDSPDARTSAPARPSDSPGGRTSVPARPSDNPDRPTPAPDRPTDLSRAARDRSSPFSSSSSAAPAEHRPTLRPRVEVTVNELTGTLSWRTLDRPTQAPPTQHGTPGTHGTGHRRTPAPRTLAPWSARAAALRSAGLDPSRTPAKGAAPIPTHPGAVRAALSVDVGALTPERRSSHLARLGALRSAVTADLAHGTGMPTSVASRLRSTTATPAHTHALTTHRASAVTRPWTPAPAPAPTHRRSP